MSQLQITAHAILRYAERVNGYPVDHARQTLAEKHGREVNDAWLLEYLTEHQMIDVEAIRAQLDTKAARIQAGMGKGNVITSKGRIVIDNATVITFLTRDMSRKVHGPVKRDRKIWIRGQRVNADL